MKNPRDFNWHAFDLAADHVRVFGDDCWVRGEAEYVTANSCPEKKEAK